MVIIFYSHFIKINMYSNNREKHLPFHKHLIQLIHIGIFIVGICFDYFSSNSLKKTWKYKHNDA